MWIKKSDLEINEFILREERKRKRLIRPFIWAFVWAGFVMLLHYLGFRGGTRGFYAFSPHVGFSSRTLTMGLMAFAVIFALVYYRQRRGMTFFIGGDDAWLCIDCYKPSSPDVSYLCPCGGQLEPYEYYRWEESESEGRSNFVAGEEIRA